MKSNSRKRWMQELPPLVNANDLFKRSLREAESRCTEKSFKGKFRNADRHDNQGKIRELQYRAFPMYYSARM